MNSFCSESEIEWLGVMSRRQWLYYGFTLWLPSLPSSQRWLQWSWWHCVIVNEICSFQEIWTYLFRLNCGDVFFLSSQLQQLHLKTSLYTEHNHHVTVYHASCNSAMSSYWKLKQVKQLFNTRKVCLICEISEHWSSLVNRRVRCDVMCSIWVRFRPVRTHIPSERKPYRYQDACFTIFCRVFLHFVRLDFVFSCLLFVLSFHRDFIKKQNLKIRNGKFSDRNTGCCLLLANQHKRTHSSWTPAGEGWYSTYLVRRDGKLSWP